MSVVDDTVEDGIGDRAIGDEIVPVCDRDLGCDQGGLPLIAFFDDFEEVEALLIGKRMCSKVVKDEELDACEFVDETRKGAIETGKCQIFEHARRADIEHGVPEPGGLSAEGAG